MGFTGLIADAERAGSLPRALPEARTTAGRHFVEGGRAPWWLWWNILSVDAPMVAVAWAALFVREGGGRLGFPEMLALALAVWAIYTMDRLLDGWPAQSRHVLRARHIFCARHRLALASAAMTAIVVILYLGVTALPRREVYAGLGLGLMVAAYMAGIHLATWRVMRSLPKEWAVGILFAAGAALPWWSRGPEISGRAAVGVGIFALLCALNCLAIERWEGRSDDLALPEKREPAREQDVAGESMRPFPFALAGVAAAFGVVCVERASPMDVFMAACAGALLLLALQGASRRLEARALRVLADVALLVPPLAVLMMRGWMR